jgi:Holliday junction resolvase-like predicted endonuclease
MFKNVPERTVIYVRDHISQYIQGTDRGMMYLAAAGGVINEYLGKNFFDDDVDAFLGRRLTSMDQIWFGYPIRIIQIGETLFLLRSCTGFPEICRRLNRSLRKAHFEMLAAKWFFQAGFDVLARPETGIKGEDFDFAARCSGEIVNVEVTALDAEAFSSKTVISRLKKKQKQLPKTAPAVVVCVLPEEWDGKGNDLNAATAAIAEEFLRNTRRVNVLVFAVERHIAAGPGGVGGSYLLVRRPYGNPNPNFQCDLGFLFQDAVSPAAKEALQRAIRYPDRAVEAAQAARTSEFYNWVDSLVP